MNTPSNQPQAFLVNPLFRTFIEEEVLPNVNINAEHFWRELESIVNDLSPKNAALLEKRHQLQAQINDWHRTHDYQTSNKEEYKNFLKGIGYLIEEGPDFTIETSNIDPEISQVSGPQLVVPVMNARFALNAANARWGSLYDALYGSDVIPKEGDLAPSQHYNQKRGAAVVRYGRDLLDKFVPLEQGSHADVTLYQVYYKQIIALMETGECVGLKDPRQFVGHNGSKNKPNQILMTHNGLHLEIQINGSSAIGKLDKAHVEDIKVEAALTTIMDCEDSVAAVDSADKVDVYRHWLGLMCGTLTTNFTKDGKTLSRRLQFDRIYTSRSGEPITLPGRSLQLIRNVGHHMYTNLVMTRDGQQVPEGIIDAITTTLIAMIDLQDQAGANDTRLKNSRAGSIYIVKPKMHGPEEVAFTDEIMSRVEKAFGLTANTIKIGIMDEERRTTLNLKECIRAVKNRCFFINTGFLDRTGDEIHTSTQAGPFTPKADMKNQPWLGAYENWNVDIGLACGFEGNAQIGKGMWAMPDEMNQMMQDKIGHPQSGATTAWVPSPTAATLHALHYHMVNVAEQQQSIKKRARAEIDDLLTLPLINSINSLSKQTIEEELNNSAQGILGYVVRWVDQGIGCSKVPNIHHVGLMEDRATLRISSQLLANWLLHGICTIQQIEDVMLRMSQIVDEQNKFTPDYTAMNPNPKNSLAFQASMDLVTKGTESKNGYTEAILHHYRLLAKRQCVEEKATHTNH